jgi:anti-anti-sigma regulatory factor
MSADAPEIAVGAVAGGLYINLCGRATQRTCPSAEQIVSDYLSSRPEAPRVILDLDGCGWVDSTFAGWLVGVTKRMERHGEGLVTLAGCGDRCRESLDRMQLVPLCRFEQTTPPEETRTVTCTTGDRPSREDMKLMLEAHEALAGLSPANEQVFGPIASMLRAQIDKA